MHLVSWEHISLALLEVQATFVDGGGGGGGGRGGRGKKAPLCARRSSPEENK